MMTGTLIQTPDSRYYFSDRFPAFFGDAFGSLPSRLLQNTQDRATWVPAMDVLEKEDGFLLRMELPGVAEEAVDISMHDGVLTVSGEAQQELDKSEGYQVLRGELRSGKYHRAIRLGPLSDLANVKASYRHGLLEIQVPKLAEATPRKIPVTGSYRDA